MKDNFLLEPLGSPSPSPLIHSGESQGEVAERSELTNERQMVFMMCECERGGFFCGESVGVVARGGAGRLSRGVYRSFSGSRRRKRGQKWRNTRTRRGEERSGEGSKPGEGLGRWGGRNRLRWSKSKRMNVCGGAGVKLSTIRRMEGRKEAEKES